MSSKKPKVLLAMSGGVDSSVAAALLLREGYEVVGVFMRLGSPGETFDELRPYEATCDPAKIKIGHQGCCSINDAADARLVAAELGIPFYVCNFKKDFGRIIDYFVDEYAAGRTPNPCVRCNDWLKFGKLHEYAKQIDAEFVASGHYARIHTSRERERAGLPAFNSQPRLLRGLDQSKDQSYVLFGVPRDHLSRMLLPIGEYEKSEVREMARELGLPVFDKPDSQEICFVPDNDYAALVEARRPSISRAGRILDTDGNEVGAHPGHHHFTIGQRRGVGVALGYPIYVVGKDPEANTITIGRDDDLLTESCTVGEANWLIDGVSSQSEATRNSGAHALNDWLPCLAQYRYNSDVVPARYRILPDAPEDSVPTHSGRRGRFEVQFDSPQRAVAPGQALVLYDSDKGEVVIGGGWIARAD